jgi:hypothetical protein
MIKPWAPHCYTLKRCGGKSTENKRVSVSNGTDPINWHAVLQRPLLGVVPIHGRYCVKFSTAAIMASSLANAVESLAYVHSQVPQMSHFVSHRCSCDCQNTLASK